MKKYLSEICIILLLITIPLCGIFSMDFTKSFSYINQYGDEVKIFGSGIYKADSYFKAAIFIGTDFAVLLFGVPLFIISLVKNIRVADCKTELRLTSIEAVTLYYGASLCFISLYLMKKQDSLGTILYAILLQSIIVVAVMMITQSAVQIIAGVDIPLPALVSKSLIFVILGFVAAFLDRRLYKAI